MELGAPFVEEVGMQAPGLCTFHFLEEQRFFFVQLSIKCALKLSIWTQVF